MAERQRKRHLELAEFALFQTSSFTILCADKNVRCKSTLDTLEGNRRWVPLLIEIGL